jgi:DDE superfamily endonuclease
MPTPRKPTPPTTQAIDAFCAGFDDLFCRSQERAAFRHYLIGLLLPREHNKTVVELAAIVPGAERQRKHHFLHDAPWDAEALNRRRLARWRADRPLGPHAGGVRMVDETGDPKRGRRSVLAAPQYLGKRGHVANGGVAVTSHWADGRRHVPLGVPPYRPASRLAKGRRDPAFHPKPQLAWQLIEEARAAGLPFHLVVADSLYGENAALEAQLFAAQIPFVLGRRPSHGTGQVVEDAAHPPGAPAGLHPSGGGGAAAAGGLGAHGGPGPPRQGTGALRGRTDLGHGLRAGPASLPDRRDARSRPTQARVHRVPGHLIAAERGQSGGGRPVVPPARRD